MKTRLSTLLLSVAMLSAYGFAFVGCGGESKPVAATPAADDHPHDHDHSDGAHEHDAHDHPEHGKNGGHMVELSNNAKTEVSMFEDVFTVYIDELEDVSNVVMKTNIDGKETIYEFERADTTAGVVYGLHSPELATAVKMGKDVVQTELVITTADGDVTGSYEHHSH